MLFKQVLVVVILSMVFSAAGADSRAAADLKEKLEASGLRYRRIEALTNGQLFVNLTNCKTSDLSVLTGFPVRVLLIGETEVTNLDLLPLMPVDILNLSSTRVTNLDPLRKMQIRGLNLELVQVSDIKCLSSLPIEDLVLRSTKVKSLEALSKMPLRYLDIGFTPVSDLSPLEGLKLERLKFSPELISKGMEVIRKMSTLKCLEVSSVEYTAAQFWEKYDRGDFSGTSGSHREKRK